MKPTTGLGLDLVLLYFSRNSAASSSIVPPISQITTMPKGIKDSTKLTTYKPYLRFLGHQEKLEGHLCAEYQGMGLHQCRHKAFAQAQQPWFVRRPRMSMCLNGIRFLIFTGQQSDYFDGKRCLTTYFSGGMNMTWLNAHLTASWIYHARTIGSDKP